MYNSQRSGAGFAAMLRERERDNPAFGFLHLGHAHYPYFMQQLKQVLASEHAGGRQSPENDPAAKRHKADDGEQHEGVRNDAAADASTRGTEQAGGVGGLSEAQKSAIRDKCEG